MTLTTMRTIPRSRKQVTGVAVLTLLAGGLFATTAQAQSSSPTPVPIEATVVSSGPAGQLIECAWALPDPSSRRGSKPTWSDLMNGYTTGSAVANDDMPSVKPVTPPCKTPEIGLDGSRPIQTDRPSLEGAPIHIEVSPNINDEPTLRYIELWSAVDSTSNGTIVHWKVFHPDGTFKVQVDGTNYTPGSGTGRFCAGPPGMFNMAVATGQIDGPTATNATPQIHDSLQDYCLQNEKDFYYGAFGLSKHQPYGKYKIEATAIKPANGGQSTLTYWIEVNPVLYVARDFDGVTFKNLQAGQDYQISGDTVWGGDKPTLQSQGNAGVTAEMAYTNLCLLVGSLRDCGPAKRVDEFNGALGTSIAAVEHRYPIKGFDTDALAAASTFQGFLPQETSNFGPRYRTLCPNDLAKIDFSAHTPRTLSTGNYAGKVHLKFVASPLCPTDKKSVYGPPFNDPNVSLLTSFDGTTPMETGYYADVDVEDP